jgi:ABC-type transport system substrate-binding protein
VLEANPDFRNETYPSPGRDPADAAIASLTGRKLPLTGTVDIAIVEEAQPRMLSFDRGLLDYVSVPPSLAPTVLDADKLNPQLARGVVLHREPEPSLAFFFFNIDDPVVGGYELRQSRCDGRSASPTIAKARSGSSRNGQAIVADQPVPPGLYGIDRSIAAQGAVRPGGRRARCSDRFGYKDRDGDGYRETPDGKPRTLQKGATTDAEARSADELWKRNMDAIGIRITFIKNKWTELSKMTEAGQMMMWGLGWISGIPDGDPFYSYLVSRNIGTSNDARLRLPEYDRLYEQAHALPDGPARNAIYRKLNDIIANYAPWILADYPYRNDLTQPWLRGFKANAFQRWQWAYYDAGAH